MAKITINQLILSEGYYFLNKEMHLTNLTLNTPSYGAWARFSPGIPDR